MVNMKFIDLLLSLFKPKRVMSKMEEPKKELPVVEPVAVVEVKVQPLTMSDKGLKMLMASEGFRSKPYLDTRGIPTTGYGSTYYEDGTPVQLTDPEITEARALELKKQVLKKMEEEVQALIKVPVNQNQYDAIMNLVYNIGVHAFTNSTLLKALNLGKYDVAAEQFLVWKRSGSSSNILLKRRIRERELFLTKVEG